MHITLQDIHKRYYRAYVLRGVNLNIAPGEIVALTGNNGTGKTTLLNIASGLVSYDSGHVMYDDKALEVDESFIKARLGYLGDNAFLLPGLKTRQFLKFVSLLHDIPAQKYEAFLQTTGMFFLGDESIHEKPVNSLSLGQQRRVSLCSTFIHEPTVILLDEPFSSLDNETCEKLINYLIEKAESGAAIIVATHDFKHISKLCTHVAVLHEGIIRWFGTQKKFNEFDSTPEKSFSYVVKSSIINA